MSETRPRVTAYFAEPDDKAAPLLQAIGQAVFAVASLENNLRLEIAHLLMAQNLAAGIDPNQGLDSKLASIHNKPGGWLLQELRDLELPADLVERIDDVIHRRNQLVHHLLEDPEFVKAVTSNEGTSVVVERIERLALDCAQLAVEIQLFALPKLEAMMGSDLSELITTARAVAPESITDPQERKMVEAIQAAGDLTTPPLFDETPDGDE